MVLCSQGAYVRVPNGMVTICDGFLVLTRHLDDDDDDDDFPQFSFVFPLLLL